MTVATPAALPVARPARGPALALLVAARPRQWTKNLLLFAGLLFAGKVDDPSRWLEASAAFACLCAVSSAAYLLNDACDAADDRKHPTKRFRPIASGEVAPRRALRVAAALGFGGIAAAAALGLRPFALVALFGLGQLGYTLLLKQVAFADVTAIAGLFVLRAAIGTAAVHVRTSSWLLLCTALLALFLGFAKRRGEQVLVDASRTPGRHALERYSRRVLDGLVWATAAMTAAAYVAYCLTAHDSLELVATAPFVLVGLGRYLHLVHRTGLGEEPEHVLLTDPVILLAVASWAVVATSVLASM